MTAAYVDAASGVSGDMFLGALVDAGVDLGVLQRAVDRLGVDGLRLTAVTTRRNGVAATKVDVTYPVQDEVRGLREVLAIIVASGLAPDVAAAATSVFRRLAAAEAVVHGVSVDEVHFHEVGAADALADVVGTAAGLHELGVTRLFVGSVNVGSGTVACEHGVLPVPAPATARRRTKTAAMDNPATESASRGCTANHGSGMPAAPRAESFSPMGASSAHCRSGTRGEGPDLAFVGPVPFHGPARVWRGVRRRQTDRPQGW